MGVIARGNSGTLRFSAFVLALCFVFVVTGCKKKTTLPPTPPPPVVKEQPPPPPAAKPVIATFEAEPSTINKGGDSTLRWSVTGDATDIQISPGIGRVDANGSRRVFPSNTTVYTLTATGAGGSDSRDVTVTVSSPPPPVTATPTDDGIRTLADLLNRDVQDAYFDYDKYDIREEARAVLTKDADALKSAFGRFGTGTIILEGHCDERGSAEYNLALGDRRATAARDFLVQLGVDPNRLKTVSYGKERPQCTEANESCWQRNRRVHFAVQQ